MQDRLGPLVSSIRLYSIVLVVSVRVASVLTWLVCCAFSLLLCRRDEDDVGEEKDAGDFGAGGMPGMPGMGMGGMGMVSQTS